MQWGEDAQSAAYGDQVETVVRTMGSTGKNPVWCELVPVGTSSEMAEKNESRESSDPARASGHYPRTEGAMKEHAQSPRQRAPWHLWLVGTLGLLFNSVGSFDYFMTQTQNESYRGRFTSEQLEVLYGFPAWLVVFWALAVWGGALGALLTLLRKRLAVPVLFASLLAMIVTAIHNFASANGLYETGGTGPGFILVIFVVALGLWLYAQAMGARGVLV